MKIKFYIVMDFYFSEIQGGAEINAESLMDRMIEADIDVHKMKCTDISVEFLKKNKDCVFIFSNFIFLKEECKQYAINNLKYFVYEQDHKYIRSRNPIKYVDFKSSVSERVNIDFYRGAVKSFIFDKNVYGCF